MSFSPKWLNPTVSSSEVEQPQWKYHPMHQEWEEACPKNPKCSHSPHPFQHSPESAVQLDSAQEKSHQQTQNRISILVLSKNHLPICKTTHFSNMTHTFQWASEETHVPWCVNYIFSLTLFCDWSSLICHFCQYKRCLFWTSPKPRYWNHLLSIQNHSCKLLVL